MTIASIGFFIKEVYNARQRIQAELRKADGVCAAPLLFPVLILSLFALPPLHSRCCLEIGVVAR